MLDPQHVILRFGKYRGETLQSVSDRDDAYLWELMQTLEHAGGPTYRALVQYLYRTNVQSGESNE